MSMADRDGKIWMDGKLIDWRDANIHVLTHTLHYGMGVFEGVRAYKTGERHAIFRLKEHTKRLFNSAKIFQMDVPFDHETLAAAQREVVRENKLESCYHAPDHLGRLGKARRIGQGQHHPRGDRRVAVGRLSRRRRHRQGHPREDVVVHAPSRERLDGSREGVGLVRELDPREPGSHRRRLRRSAAARCRRLRLRRLRRKLLPREQRQAVHAGPVVVPRRHHARHGHHAGARRRHPK